MAATAVIEPRAEPAAWTRTQEPSRTHACSSWWTATGALSASAASTSDRASRDAVQVARGNAAVVGVRAWAVDADELEFVAALGGPPRRTGSGHRTRRPRLDRPLSRGRRPGRLPRRRPHQDVGSARSRMAGHPERAAISSVRPMLTARTRTSASPEVGRGTGASDNASTSGPPNAVIERRRGSPRHLVSWPSAPRGRPCSCGARHDRIGHAAHAGDLREITWLEELAPRLADARGCAGRDPVDGTLERDVSASNWGTGMS